MAINSNNVLEDRNPIRSLCSSKTSNLSSCRLIKINFAGKDSCSSSRAHGTNNNKDIKSPYFTNDKAQLLSRVIAKKVSNKKPATEFISSFPLAASVYKANSDEFKLKRRGNKKVKKSVLTLPNEPVPVLKTYTVSDFNDSEYFNAANDNRNNKPKKRRPVKRTKKTRVKERTMEFADRDARYCSQLNIDLDCSSSEIINITGDGERISKLSYKSNNSVKTGYYPHDVWSVLRNINNFQFGPSPPASQKSAVPLRNRRPNVGRGKNNNDTHYIETCRTEEFAYISSFEVDSKTHESCSPSSSFDRVTVIDKQSEQDEIKKQFSHNIFGSNLKLKEKTKSNTNNQIKRRNKPLKNGNKKALRGKKKTDTAQVVANNTCNTDLQIERKNVSIENSNDLPEIKIDNNTSSIFKPTENCSDICSIIENFSISNDLINNFEKDLRSDDACKCSNMKISSKSPNTRANLMKPIDDAGKQFNGITKVILNKGKELVSPKLSETQRKPRLALTLPNSNIPNLSRFEIKRRLANQKFPIVILGKDQLTNCGMYVANVDPPQFDGLDKQIWPFMLKWSEEHTGKTVDIQKEEITKTKIKNKVNHRNQAQMNVDDLHSYNISPKKVEHKKKKNSSLLTTNNQTQLASEISSDVVQKPKPLVHLKNKMFNFLHKNPTLPKYSVQDWSNNRQAKTVLEDKHVGTYETVKNYNYLNNKCSLISVCKEVSVRPVENKIVQKPFSPVRHQWAKGKWASDFIENIIKKIRNGVYYGVDRKTSQIINKHISDGTEVSTQTEINSSKNVYCQNGVDLEFTSNVEFKKDDPLKDIPGFDKTLATLEIETISTNKIAVKHCITNVVVHFDIQVLGETKNVTHTKKSMSCIPVDANNNQEKVFKCNTSIINAILPAELCSIIPTMMQSILDTENKMFLETATVQEIHSYPTAVAKCIEPKRPRLSMSSLSLGSPVSSELKPFINGRFRNTHLKYDNIRTVLLRPTESMNTVPLYPRFNAQILSYYNQSSVNLRDSIIPVKMAEKPNQVANISHNHCMALQLYEPKRFSIVPYVGLFNATEFMKQIVVKLNELKLNKTIKIMYRDLTSHNTDVIMNRPLLLERQQKENVLSLPLGDNKLGIISLFKAFKKNYQCNSEFIPSLNTNETDIEEKKEKPRIPIVEGKTVVQKKGQAVKVLRKKSYVRFYRKCNSMSSISSYKCSPLSKVTNLEEFCQVLGSNVFCSVLDGCLEKKVLSAIEEMKNWISEMSPKQALLVLLLTNKKDTSNLIRFRPVLLQGIAMNRITKADELDTEIEVIERENFHKLSQCEGISYLPASPKNQDSLLEELYWIAKTTASDYQKPFDESSEKLLKSLLEKRKKLNPSYLRVMARYVGLGLLAPTKL